MSGGFRAQRLEGSPNEPDHLSLAELEQRSPLVLTHDRPEDARLRGRADVRRAQHERSSAGAQEGHPPSHMSRAPWH